MWIKDFKVIQIQLTEIVNHKKKYSIEKEEYNIYDKFQSN